MPKIRARAGLASVLFYLQVSLALSTTIAATSDSSSVQEWVVCVPVGAALFPPPSQSASLLQGHILPTDIGARQCHMVTMAMKQSPAHHPEKDRY